VTDPYRGSETRDEGRIRPGESLVRYDLGQEIRAPFREADGEGSLVKQSSQGLVVAMRRPLWSHVYRFVDYPLADVSIRARVSVTGHPKASVLLYARCFEIGSTRLFYAAAFHPRLGEHRLCRYANAEPAPLTTWSATEAFPDPDSAVTVELRVAADLLVVLVDGSVVQEHRDRSFGAGCPGLELWGHEVGDRFVVESVEVSRIR
jgi:hypothetical protein